MSDLGNTWADESADVTLASLAGILRRDLHELGAIPRSRAERGLADWAAMNGVQDKTASTMAKWVVEAVSLCGDIATGSSFGEPMLLKRNRRTIMLDADRAILLGGDPEEGEAHGLIRISDSNDPTAPNLADVVLPLDFAGEKTLRLLLETRRWQPKATDPSGLMYVLFCLGLGDDTTISDDVAEKLLDLYPSFQIWNEQGLDSGQGAVVELPSSAKVLVTAGPGSGKTHTASARIAHLVQHGVDPAGIHLVTFTRVAAETARLRITDAIRDVAYGAGVQSGTLDSFAWHFIASVSEAQNTSHRDTIRSATKRLLSPDALVRDRLARINHLVIDEAQDIVGERLELCRTLLGALPEQTGVTVFGDWAQAIYGSWAEGKSVAPPSKANLHLALHGAAGWQQKELSLNHRTRSPALRRMFIEARALLSDNRRDPKDCYVQMRSLIEEAATNPSADLLGPVLPWRYGNLVLFRGRASAEAGSARLVAAGRPHRLKLSGRTLVADPLIGALCAGLTTGMSISLDQVKARCDLLDPIPVGIDPDQAYSALRQVAGSGRAPPLVSKVAEGLEAQPLWAVRDHIGTAGPLLGSIHGAKGQEADDVLLMLSPMPVGDNVDWIEEARVLFVAATRASRHLHIGHARSAHVTERSDGTRWLQGRGLSLFGTEGLVPFTDSETARRIWTAAFSHPLCSFAREDKTGAWQMVLENGRSLAGVDNALAGALDYLASDHRSLPFGRLRVVGATSVTFLGPAGRVAGVTLLPVLQGILNGHRTKEHIQ